MLHKITMTSQGQVTVPAVVRKKLNTKHLYFEEKPDGEIVLGSFLTVDDLRKTLVLPKNFKFKTIDDMVKFHEGVLDEVFS